MANNGVTVGKKLRNGYTPREKLDIALEMTEMIVDIDGFRDRVIAHYDVHTCDWLNMDMDGILLLGELNRAAITDWNKEDRECYCVFNNGGGYRNINILSIGERLFS